MAAQDSENKKRLRPKQAIYTDTYGSRNIEENGTGGLEALKEEMGPAKFHPVDKTQPL